MFREAAAALSSFLGTASLELRRSSSRLGYFHVNVTISRTDGFGSTYGDGEVVAASELSDLASVSERSTHNDGLVAKLLVVVEDAVDGGDTRVLLLGVLLLVVGLEPVEDSADEGGDEVGTGLGSADGLDEREHEGEVGVDAVVALKNLGGLDTLPSGGDLDQDAVLGDALLTVELLYAR